jgi:hypothetical protein
MISVSIFKGNPEKSILLLILFLVDIGIIFNLPHYFKKSKSSLVASKESWHKGPGFDYIQKSTSFGCGF